MLSRIKGSFSNFRLFFTSDTLLLFLLFIFPFIFIQYPNIIILFSFFAPRFLLLLHHSFIFPSPFLLAPSPSVFPFLSSLVLYLFFIFLTSSSCIPSPLHLTPHLSFINPSYSLLLSFPFPRRLSASLLSIVAFASRRFQNANNPKRFTLLGLKSDKPHAFRFPPPGVCLLICFPRRPWLTLPHAPALHIPRALSPPLAARRRKTCSR